MWLHRESICNILNLTEEVFLSKIKKHNQLATTERIELIRKELFKNKETGLEIDKKCLYLNIKRMLSKNPPEKIFIGISETPRDEVNLSTETIDLDSSLMSIDCLDNEVSDSTYYDRMSKKNLIIELKKANLIIVNQKKELDSLRSIRNIFQCEPKRGAFTYGKKVDNIAVGLLCQAESSRSISRFFETIAKEFPVFLESSDSQFKKNTPQKSYINSLRDILPQLITLHLSDYLNVNCKDGQKYILTIDQTTISDNVSIIGMGIVNQRGDYHSLGLIESSARKGLDISSAMKSLVENTGFYDEIIDSCVGIMSDRCASQLLANRDFIKHVHEEKNISLMQLNCFMHTCSNSEKIYCDSFDDLSPNIKAALHKTKLLLGGRKTMGFQRNSLKEMFADVIGGKKTTHFLSDLGSRFGVFYNNSRNLLLHKDAVIECLNNIKESNLNAVGLNELYINNWVELSLGFGAIVMFWACILGPFNSTTTTKTTVRETIECIELTRETFERIKNTDSPFEELYSEIRRRCWPGSTKSNQYFVRNLDWRI
jgi:hypothetical protein